VSAAWWNGRLVAAEEVAIAPDDAGVLHGDGLFETLRVDGGRVRDLDAHLDRLFASLPRIDLEIPERRRALAATVRVVAKAAPRPAARLRITVTRGVAGVPTRLVTAVPYEPPSRAMLREGVAAVVLHDLRLEARGALTGLKSLSYGAHALAQLRARAAGAWEALLLDKEGLLMEGSRSNVVLVLERGRAYTPPAAEGCVPGTVRRRLLEAGLIEEGEVFDDDLPAASEVLLTNSLVGVLPVGRIGELRWSPGPVYRRLRKALRR
jgi:branched-chain amino acid aminotransferase